MNKIKYKNLKKISGGDQFKIRVINNSSDKKNDHIQVFQSTGFALTAAPNADGMNHLVKKRHDQKMFEF